MNEEEIRELIANVFGDMEDTTAVGEQLRQSFTRSAIAAGKNVDNVDDLIVSTDTLDETQKAYNKTANLGIAGISGLATMTSKLTQSMMAGSESLEGMRAIIAPLQGIIETVFSGFGSILSAVGGGLAGVASLLPVVGEGLGKMLKGLSGFFDFLSGAIGKALSGVVGIIGNAMVSVLEQAITMFKGVTSSGLLFTDGILGMVGQMNSLMLFQEEYTAVVKNNAESLTLIGGSVAQGMNKLTSVIGKYDKALGESSTTARNELYNMGIGYQEQTENLVDYMAQLALTGNLQKTTADQLALGSFEYMKNLKVISALTGKSADEMQKERNEALGNLAFRNKLSKLGAEQQVKIMTALNRVPAEGQKAMKEAIVFGKVISDIGAIQTGMAGHYEGFAKVLLDGNVSAKDAVSGFMLGLKADLPRLEASFQSLDAVGRAALVGAGNAVSDALHTSVASQLKLATKAGEFTVAKHNEAWNAGTGTGANGIEVFFKNLRDGYGDLTQMLASNSKPLIDTMNWLTSGLSTFFKDLNLAISGPEGIKGFKPVEFLTEQVKKMFGVEPGESIFGSLTDGLAESMNLSEEWVSIKEMMDGASRSITSAMAEVSKGMADIVAFFAQLSTAWWFPGSSGGNVIATPIRGYESAGSAQTQSMTERPDGSGKIAVVKELASTNPRRQYKISTLKMQQDAAAEAAEATKRSTDADNYNLRVYELKINELQNKNATLEQGMQNSVTTQKEADPKFEDRTIAIQIDNNQKIINGINQLIKEIKIQTAALI